jgi:hypothetical protein
MKFHVKLFLILFSFSTMQLYGQQYVTTSPDSVCAGSSNQVYRIPPVSSNPTSNYSWSITGGGTVVTQVSDDSIYVNWSNTIGSNFVNVSETTSGGCVSPQATLEVRRYRPTATLTNSTVNLCAGVGGSVSYDVNFTGRQPFSVSYVFSNGGLTIGPFTENNITTNSHQIGTTIPAILAIAGTYTCTITAASDKGGCTASSVSGTATLIISQPAAPTASVTVQPTCAVGNGTIAITAPTGAGITYSIGSAYQSATTFTSVAPGTYTVTAQNANGCISPTTTSVTVNAQPSAPVAPTASVTVQPTCATGTGTIVVTAPTGAGITYSIGGAYQATATFNAVTPGTYTVTAQNSSGCISPTTTSVTVNAQPSTPVAPTASVTAQPTCETGTGTIVITAPTGAGITYSIGGAYQSTATFNAVTPGTYTVTAQNSSGCISPTTTSVTVNAQPSTPVAPTASVTVQPTCGTGTGTIVISGPTGAGITYSIGGAYQSSATFNAVTPGTYTVTAQNSSGCISPTTTSVTVNAQPSTPAAPTASVTVQPTCSVATGTIVITAPTGAGITYSIGGAYQPSATFNLVSPGTYTITAQNSSGCISPTTTSVTVDAAPSAPITPIIQHIR